jgi:ADP-ribose pyrophosphatase
MKWKLLSEKMNYAGYRKVLGRTFELPNGVVKEYDVYKTTNFACVLPVLHDGKFLLTKQFRPGPQKIFLVPPGGVCEIGESSVNAIQREFAEETGYEGSVTEIATTLQDAYATGTRTHFVALNCKPMTNERRTSFPQDSDEFIENVVLTQADLIEQILKGCVSDVETCLLGLNWLQNRG